MSDAIMGPGDGFGGLAPGGLHHSGDFRYTNAFGLGAGNNAATGESGFQQMGLGGDPIIADTGENVFQSGDMMIWHDGTYISVTRIYRHLTANPAGTADFGPNFHSNLWIEADEINSTTVDIYLGTGVTLQFTYNGTSMEWESPTGYERYLLEKVTTSGSDYQYELSDNNGYTWIFEEENSTSSTPYMLAETQNRFGEGQTYNYSGGYLSSIDCNDYVSITIVRDSTTHQIEEIIDAEGRSVKYGYESSSPYRLLTIEDSCGTCGSVPNMSVRFEYDGNGKLEKIYNGDDTLVRTIAYSSDKVSSITDHRSNVWSFTYDTSSTTMTDPGGYDHEYDFDTDGNITAATHEISLSPLETVTFNYSYDSSFNLTTIDSPDDYDRVFVYDDRNRLCRFDWKDGLGEVVKSSAENVFDDDGKTTEKIDPQFRSTMLTYSGQQLTAIDLPSATNDRVLSYTANTVRDWFATQITDATGKVTQASIEYETDYVEIRTKQQKSAGVFTADSIKRYDLSGRLIYDAPAATPATTLNYNNAGQLESRVSDGVTTEFGYDDNGKIATNTIKKGGTTRESWTYAHDAVGRMLSMENDTVGGETTFTYDARGLLSVKTDPAGLQTKYTYDGLGRTTRVQQGDGTTWRNVQILSYDAMGRVTSVLDGQERETVREYDSYGRLATVIDHDEDYTTYMYDAADRVTNVRRFDASDNLLERTKTTYSTDRGWPIEVRRYSDADGVANDTLDAVTTTTFDDEGRVEWRRVYYSASGYNQTSYTYDGAAAWQR